jgi:hypothetical protein
VQVQTGRLRDGAVRFKTQSVRCNMREAYTRGYAGEIDVTKNGQAEGIRWAAEYELPA